MYICICNAITDKQVEEAAKTSASFDEACKKLGVGSECGVCLQEAVASYFQQHHQQKNSENQTKVQK